MESRYHFENPSPQIISENSTPKTQHIEIPSERPQIPVNTPSNQSEGFDSLSFLGISSTNKSPV